MLRHLLLILVLLAENQAVGRVQYNRSFAEQALGRINAPVLQIFSPVEKAFKPATALVFATADELDDPTIKRHLRPNRLRRPNYVVDRTLEYKKWRKAQIAPGLMIGGGSAMACGAMVITAGVLRDERSTARGDLSGIFLAFTGILLAGIGIGMLATGAALHHRYGRYRHSQYNTPY